MRNNAYEAISFTIVTEVGLVEDSHDLLITVVVDF